MAEFRCSRPPYLLRHRHRSNNREAARRLHGNTPYAPCLLRRSTPYDHPFVAPPSDAARRRPPCYTPAVGPSFNSPPRLHHGTPYDLSIHHRFVYDCPEGPRRHPSYLPAAAPSYEGPRRHPCYHPAAAPSYEGPRRRPSYPPAAAPSYKGPSNEGPRRHPSYPPAAAPSYEGPRRHLCYPPAAAPSYEGPRRRPSYPLAAAPSYEGPRRHPSYPPAAAPSYEGPSYEGPRRRPSYPPAAAPSSEGPRPLPLSTKSDFPSNRKATVNTDALLPHQILASAFHTPYSHNEEHARMAEHRWERMVSALRSQGKFRNSIAGYHVSTNMSETAKQVSIAMALLISELSQPPWKGKVFKFHEDPALFNIEGNSIVDKAKFLRDHVHCSWPQYYLDYEMVFSHILKVAKDAKQKQDEMIKRVFLFTDCSFQSSSYYRAKVHGKSHYWLDDSWKHEYPMLRSMFSKAGYAMPKIVFWDLTDIPWVCSDTEPFTDIPSVYSDTECSDTEDDPRMPEGVTQMVGGMSDDLLELFLEKDAVLTKHDFMEARCDRNKLKE